jgi:hypothetical protein
MHRLGASIVRLAATSVYGATIQPTRRTYWPARKPVTSSGCTRCSPADTTSGPPEVAGLAPPCRRPTIPGDRVPPRRTPHRRGGQRGAGGSFRRRSGGESEGGRDRAQAQQRLALELTASPLADAELGADLLMAEHASAGKPVARDQHRAMALGQPAQHFPQLRRLLSRDRRLRRVRGGGGGRDVSRRQGLRAERLLERGRNATGRAQRPDRRLSQFGARGDPPSVAEPVRSSSALALLIAASCRPAFCGTRIT